MKNNLFHILRYCILFIGIVILSLSCDSQKDSKKEVEKENNENVILVNTDVRDSLYHLYDSVSKLWQRSIKDLQRLDRLAQTKAGYGQDFAIDYESALQYVYQLPIELNGLDSICTTVGIFTFNCKIYKSPEKALETIDSVLNNKTLKLSDKQKEQINKDRNRLLVVKGKEFKNQK